MRAAPPPPPKDSDAAAASHRVPALIHLQVLLEWQRCLPPEAVAPPCLRGCSSGAAVGCPLAYSGAIYTVRRRVVSIPSHQPCLNLGGYTHSCHVTVTCQGGSCCGDQGKQTGASRGFLVRVDPQQQGSGDGRHGDEGECQTRVGMHQGVTEEAPILDDRATWG